MAERLAKVKRETGETSVEVELHIDGSGQCQTKTGIRFFDHLLDQLARHGVFDLKVLASGSEQHHLVEDVAICVGWALNQALGDRRGIVRMSQALVPMDDALAQVAVDISGRGYAVVEVALSGSQVGDLESGLIEHFLRSLAHEARLNLHAKVIYGSDDHHKAEALFKALARALDEATCIDLRRKGVPSTKGVIES
jgi:imidazoleglycerol-phosphate dehydratase